jgi:hypothetical protein
MDGLHAWIKRDKFKQEQGVKKFKIKKNLNYIIQDAIICPQP